MDDRRTIYQHYIALHKAGVVHNSAKKKHWYRSHDGSIRLIDFGSAVTCEEDSIRWKRKLREELEGLEENLGPLKLLRGASSEQAAAVDIDDWWNATANAGGYSRRISSLRAVGKEAVVNDIKNWLEGIVGEYDEEEESSSELEDLVGFVPHSLVDRTELDSKLVVNVELVDIHPPLDQIKLQL